MKTKAYRYRWLLLLLTVVSLCRSHEQSTRADSPGMLILPPDTIVPTERNGNASQTDDYAPAITVQAEADGALSAHIPLWVPPGRAGMKPDLALDYSSRGGLSTVGYGWSLSGLPVITRCLRVAADSVTGLPSAIHFGPDDQLCVDGEPLVPEGPTASNPGTSINQARTAFRTLHDDHSRYVVTQADSFGPTEIQAYGRDGRILTFGFIIRATQVRYTPDEATYPNRSDLQARCPIGEQSEHDVLPQKYGWALSRVDDRSGNEMAISWALFNDGDNCPPTFNTEYFPTQIQYASNPSSGLAATKSISFNYMTQADYGGKPDVPHWLSGMRFGNNHRLFKIESFATDPNTSSSIGVKEYLLNYGGNADTLLLVAHPELQRPHLASVTECDDAVQTVCKPPIKLDYDQDTLDGADTWGFVDTHINDMDTRATGPMWPEHIYAGDFNHDGKDDVAFLSTQINPTSGRQDYVAHLATGALDSPSLSTTAIDTGLTNYNLNAHLIPFDVNGTGFRDSLYLQTDAEGAAYSWFDQTTGNSFVWPNVPRGDISFSLVADTDGDGLTDLIYSPDLVVDEAKGGFGFQVTRNSGLGGLYAYQQGEPRNPVFYSSIWQRLIDLDGDGSAEVLYIEGANWNIGQAPAPKDLLYHAVHINAAAPTTSQPFLTTLNTTDVTGYVSYSFADINGDGLVDALNFYGDGHQELVEVRLNTGAGFYGAVYPVPEIPAAGIWNAGAVIDWNNDGRQDVVYSDVNNSLWVLWFDGDDSTPGGLKEHFTPLAVTAPLTTRFTGLDVNGDGLDDLAIADFDANHNIDMNLMVRNRGVMRNRLLKRIDRAGVVHGSVTAPGEQFDIQYAPIIDPNVYSDNCQNVAFPRACVESKIWVVSEITRGDDQHGTAAPVNDAKYKYENARADMRGRGFLGFEKVTQTDQITGAAVESHYDLTQTEPPLPGVPWPLTLYAYAGQPTYVRSSEHTSQAFGQSTFHDTVIQNTYTFVPTAGNAFFVYAGNSQKTVTEYVQVSLSTPPTSTVLAQDTTSTVIDVQGNLQSQSVERIDGSVDRVEHAYTMGADDGTWRAVLADAITETSATPSASLARGRMIQFGSNWLAASEMLLSADGRGDQQLNVTIQRTTEGLPWIVTRSETAARGGASRKMVYTYDALERAFLTSATDDSGNSAQFAFHPGYGLLGAARDRDGTSRRFSYDGFGRTMHTGIAGGEQVAYSYCQSSSNQPDVAVQPDTVVRVLENHDDGQGPRAIVEYNWMKEATTETTYARFDGQGTQRSSTYDPYDGRLLTRTAPYFLSTSPGQEETYHYDNFRRVISRTGIDGATWQYSYSGLNVTTLNVDDNVSSYVVLDSQGRVSSSVEYVTAGDGTLQPSATQYAYGPFGSLYRKTDAEGNVSTFEVNGLGETYHQLDGDSGERHHLFNAFGELETEQTPEYTTTFAYDLSGRTRTETTTGMASGGVRVNKLNWDTATNGAGKLASMLSPDGVTTTFTYDSSNRLESKTQQVAGSQFTFGFSYDTYGRALTLTYPAVHNEPPFTVKYNLGAYGALTSVSDYADSTPLWTKTDSDPTDQFETAILGNGIKEQSLQSTSRPGRLGKHVVTNSAGQKLADYTYDYDGRGNVTAKTDLNRHHTQQFTYDAMNRMTRWVWSGAAYGSTDYRYEYDPLGNLFRMTAYGNGIQAFQRNYAHDSVNFGPHQIAYNDSLQSWFAYDHNGRQTFTMGGEVITQYNEWDLPITNGWFTYSYDGQHSRIRRLKYQGDEEITLDGLYSRDISGPTVTHWFRVYAGGKEVASREEVEGGATTTLYLNLDHLGSAELSTDASQGVVDDLAWTPQGDLAAPVPPFEYATSFSGFPGAFEGNTGDPYAYIYDFKGRTYDPRQMRFLTPDPHVGSTHSGQSWNGYSFVLNNPATFTDPTGFDTFDRSLALGTSGQTLGPQWPPPGLGKLGSPPTDDGPSDRKKSAPQEQKTATVADPVGQSPSSPTGVTGASPVTSVGPSVHSPGESGIPGGWEWARAPRSVDASGPAHQEPISQLQAFAQVASPLPWSGSYGRPTNPYSHVLRHVSAGVSAGVTALTPLGGGSFGFNLQLGGGVTGLYFYYPSNWGPLASRSGSNMGWSLGPSFELNYAIGTGHWSGDFLNMDWGAGPLAGSVFFSPSGPDHWRGASFGVGFGPTLFGGGVSTTHFVPTIGGN